MKRLFVDNRREYPKVGYECCRDVDSAKLLLSIMQFGYISLDYDLGDTEETGLDILIWMKEKGIVVPKINIHSDHPVGREKMYDFCAINFPQSKITMQSIWN